MPRKRGRGRLSAPNGFSHSDLLAARSGGDIQAKQATSLEESVRNAWRLKPSAEYQESAPGASMDSNSTSHSAMSENSRRSSASSAAMREGDSHRPGKRKRRTETSEFVDSNYSLRRRRSRILPDANGDYSQPLESPRESSAQDPEMDYFSSALANQLPEGLDVDRPTEAEDVEIPPIVEPKKRGRRAYRLRQETPPESQLATPAPGTPMNGNDLGTGVNTDQEPARLVRRLPGRRRAPNPNSSIEADLRRQLTLKTTFRSVVKALKPVLLELSSRSIEQLEEQEDSFKECPEYDEIVARLDQYLKRRLAEVDARHRLDVQRIEGDLKNGQEYIHDEFKYRVEETRDEHVHRVLNSLAGIQKSSKREDDEDLTDDEDVGDLNMIAPTESVIFARPGIGTSISRSHIFTGVEQLDHVEKVHDAASSRITNAIPTEDLDEDIMELETGLGSIDLSRREEAVRLLNMQCLADAADAAETADRAAAAAVRRRSRRNEDHSGFDALLEASKKLQLENGQDEQVGRHLRSRNRPEKYRGQPVLDEPIDEEILKPQFLSPRIAPSEPMDYSQNLELHMEMGPPMDTKLPKGRINIRSLLSEEPEGYGSVSTDYEPRTLNADISAEESPWEHPNLPGTSAFKNPFKGDLLKPITTLQSSDFGPKLQPGFSDVAQSIEDDTYDRAKPVTTHLDELQDPRLDQSLPEPDVLDSRLSPNYPKHPQFATPLPPRLPPTSLVPPEAQNDELRSDYPFPLKAESRYQPFTRVQASWQPPLWPYQQSSEVAQTIQTASREILSEEKFAPEGLVPKIASPPLSLSSAKWNHTSSSPPIGDYQNPQIEVDTTEQIKPRVLKEESAGSVSLEDNMAEDELTGANPSN